MLLSMYIGLIVRPIHTLQQIVEERPVGLGLLTLLIVAIANGIVTFGLGIDTSAFEEFADEEINVSVGFVVIGTLLFVAFVAVELGFFSLIVHLISKLFGGDGAYTGMLAGLMMLSVLSLIPVIPGVLDALAAEVAEGETSPFETISFIVSLVVGIWSIVLAILLIRENYRLSTGMAVLSGIASFFAAIVVGVILFILLIIVLVVIVVGLGIATG